MRIDRQARGVNGWCPMAGLWRLWRWRAGVRMRLRGSDGLLSHRLGGFLAQFKHLQCVPCPLAGITAVCSALPSVRISFPSWTSPVRPIDYQI
jgi:hypothetical protein